MKPVIGSLISIPTGAGVRGCWAEEHPVFRTVHSRENNALRLSMIIASIDSPESMFWPMFVLISMHGARAGTVWLAVVPEKKVSSWVLRDQ